MSNAYPTETAARRALEALRDSGVHDRDIRLLTRREPRDVRREPVGGFAGPAAPDAPIGTYGNRTVLRRQGAGSFAGNPDGQRQGSFADTDRITIVSPDGDAERTRVTGLRGARRLLNRAPLDDHAVDRAVSELQIGHTVVLVDLRGITASQAQAQLEQPTRVVQTCAPVAPHASTSMSAQQRDGCGLGPCDRDRNAADTSHSSSPSSR